LLTTFFLRRGESAAAKIINDEKESTTATLKSKFTSLSTTAKIGIGAGVGGAFFLAFLAFAVYCIKQRRAGKKEPQLQDEKWAEQNEELMDFRTMMAKGNFAVSRQSILMEAKEGSRRGSRF
jgi:hypothetical protein